MNHAKPKISIVLPTYNGQRWLAESIQSIINQTEKNWELIIVNDASSDNTLEIAQLFTANDQRISIISNQKNLTLPAALNIGFSMAQGQYFTWTSDDNYYAENALEKMTNYLDINPDIDLVSMNFSLIDETNKILLPDFYADDKYQRNAAYLMHGCNVGAAFMYRKSIADKIGKYDEKKFCAEDYDYWCRIALAGKIGYTNDIIYKYRKHPDSLSTTKRHLIKEKTIEIKKKYADAFFVKFHFNWRDKATFFYNLGSPNKPKKYIPYYLLFTFHKSVINLITIPIFWNKNKRHKLRRILRINEKYSFSQKKN